VGFHLTPQTMEAAYELLRTTPPFRGWRLPPGEQIRFEVVATRAIYGSHVCRAGTHVICCSFRKQRTLPLLLITMAHEMIHLYEAERKERADIGHGARFWKRAKLVCRLHGWDEGAF
jgi:hypothetical protein